MAEIQSDCPILLPEQVEDVAVMERRLITNNKQGVLLTNGTGTGKTFSGLGLIKRFANQGKKNILILAPNPNIISQWIKAAREHFGLKVVQLKSMKDCGKEGEICITTYANLQGNREVVKRNWD